MQARAVTVEETLLIELTCSECCDVCEQEGPHNVLIIMSPTVFKNVCGHFALTAPGVAPGDANALLQGSASKLRC